MTIRQATETDISAIVALLKLSLGESLMPKSEAFWRWKHIDNPFGQSPVLLAYEKDLLVGVRAFMRWEWRQGEKIYKAVRAVDTATHPEYQGKGIFSILTKQLVEECRNEGVHFIFNTPNASSMPGYLKMGWRKLGRMPIQICPVLFNPFSCISSWPDYYEGESKAYPIPSFNQVNFLGTNKSEAFLNWRYGRNPNIRYYGFKSEDTRGIFRIKAGKFFNELRLVEFFWSGKNRFEVSSLLRETARNHKAVVITWAGFHLPLLSLSRQMGPMITINPLNTDNSLSFAAWKPTLGDMEVF